MESSDRNQYPSRRRVTSERQRLLDLTDTPSVYAGNAGKTIRVNLEEDSFEYGLPFDSTSLDLRAINVSVDTSGILAEDNVQTELEDLQTQISAIPITPPTPLVRYTVSSTLNDEVYVVASGYGITYSRVGGTGTFSIPAGIIITSISMHIDSTATGTTFTIVYGDLGSSGALNNDATDYVFPMADALLESTGIRVGITTARPAGLFDRLEIRNLVAASDHHLKLIF